MDDNALASVPKKNASTIEKRMKLTNGSIAGTNADSAIATAEEAENDPHTCPLCLRPLGQREECCHADTCPPRRRHNFHLACLLSHVERRRAAGDSEFRCPAPACKSEPPAAAVNIRCRPGGKVID
uniref:RING-type domain-containing protein n=2 Tax=Macrostomum lignano TaxID=282301 RepID=A0A1I8GSQ4_9PLAT